MVKDNNIYQVAIIGGGVSGSVIALQLAKYSIDCVLFEQKSALVSGPPFCHLHAGGNLYPDISMEQCKLLMSQSIESARLFPQTIDLRPTLISIPISENLNTQEIENKLKQLAQYYKELVNSDPSNEVLGPADGYYSVYKREDLDALAKRPMVQSPDCHDDWISNALKVVDWSKLKSPIFIVQEFGWNFFRLAAQAELALNSSENCDIKLNTQILDIKDVSDLGLGYNWQLFTKDRMYKANYLVNSSGFNSNFLDSCLQLRSEHMAEFKASYTAKCLDIPAFIPELIFHGQRGTPHGMAQLTPYCGNYYQIHGMTNEITLFQDGLLKSNQEGVCPEFIGPIKQKLNGSWEASEVQNRTEKAIDYVARFVPSFAAATIGGPPLFGAQQIPGSDLSLRVGDVSFPYRFYARSEIVKASSAFTAANNIIRDIQKHKLVPFFDLSSVENSLLQSVPKNEIDRLAQEIAVRRGFPGPMSQLLRG